MQACNVSRKGCYKRFYVSTLVSKNFAGQVTRLCILEARTLCAAKKAFKCWEEVSRGTSNDRHLNAAPQHRKGIYTFNISPILFLAISLILDAYVLRVKTKGTREFGQGNVILIENRCQSDAPLPRGCPRNNRRPLQHMYSKAELMIVASVSQPASIRLGSSCVMPCK